MKALALKPGGAQILVPPVVSNVTLDKVSTFLLHNFFSSVRWIFFKSSHGSHEKIK